MSIFVYKTDSLMRYKSLIIFLFISQYMAAQDIINLKDGNEIYSKVIKISENEIEYKKFSNLEGPSYVKKLSEVESVKYKNGHIDRFDQEVKQIKKNPVKYPKISPPENDGKRISKVDKVNSLDVYFMADPLSEYEIVNYTGGQFSDFQMKNIFSYGSRSSLSSRMSFITMEALKLAKSENEEIHGILYREGNSILMIRYTDTSVKTRLGKVDTIKGLETYVFSEPHNRTYTVTESSEFKSGSLTSTFTLGLIDASMRDNIDVFINYIVHSKNKNKANAILYHSGKEGHGIKF